MAEAGGVRVFVSYRREDAPDATDRLTGALRERLGREQVFVDIDSIEIGADFADVIGKWIARCDVLLAVIGHEWTDAKDPSGAKRLDDPHDYVRLEIESALQRGVRVVPVLIHGARLPRPDELPSTLAPLLQRNALELTRKYWNLDIDELLGALDRLAEEKTPRASEERTETPEPARAAARATPGSAITRNRYMLAGVAAALCVLVGIVVLVASNGSSSRGTSAPASAQPQLSNAQQNAAAQPNTAGSSTTGSGSSTPRTLRRMSPSACTGAVSDCSNSDLSGANFRGANLQVGNFENSNLARADLSHAQLGQSDFKNAKLTGANLSGADLGQADLSNTDLQGANLSGAKFSQADLSDSNLCGANLNNADLQQADTSNARCAPGNGQ